jgi:hypothetical protein
MTPQRRPVSTIPACAPGRLRVIRERDKSEPDGEYGFRLVDTRGGPTGDGATLARASGFTSPASLEAAIAVALRRALGLRPQAADPSVVAPSTRKILAQLVEHTWGPS